MYKAMRYEDNRTYWDKRWKDADSDSDSFADTSIYPVIYADMIMSKKPKRTVELGCGLGRLVKHYHNQNFEIVGVERSLVAVEKLNSGARRYPIVAGDAANLPFRDGEFNALLAFGLFHNIEHGMTKCVAEALRCLAPGGRYCISMRPDNIEMRFNEWYWRRLHKRKHESVAEGSHFHKWLVTEKEFSALLERNGCRVDRVERARNVSLLWRIPLLRERSTSESERRSQGYRLNFLGRSIDWMLRSLFPSSFCNVLVFIGEKRN